MNYLEALQHYLQNDPEISAIVGERVWFLRIPKTIAKPYIIFNEQERSPKLLNQEDYASGRDAFPVLIDIVVDYKDANKGRELRQLIRKKIWNFNGQLTINNEEWTKWREGQISFVRFLACDYAPDTDGVLRGWLYLFKQARWS